MWGTIFWTQILISVVAAAPQVAMKDLAEGLSMDDEAFEAEKDANGASLATLSVNDAHSPLSNANEQSRVTSDSKVENPSEVTNLGDGEKGEVLSVSPEAAEDRTGSDENLAATYSANNDPSRRSDMEDRMQARDAIHAEQMDELAEKKRQELQGLVDHGTGTDPLAMQAQDQIGKAEDKVGDGVPSVEASVLGGSVDAQGEETSFETDATSHSELEDAISKTFVVADLSKGQRIKAQ